MEIKDAVNALTAVGWKSIDPTGLPSNDINAAISEYLIFENHLSLRFHSSENLIRLFIYGKASQPDFAVDYIAQIDPSLDKIGHNDVRGLQMEYEENDLEDLIPELIEMQDSLNVETYFEHYFDLQSYTSVSILAIEQFL